jgi:hypothetical protein
MASYTTALKDWGSGGQEYPDGYNYVEGEQPVDAWDNFVTSNLIDDIQHLITLTNARIESTYASSRPGSPEDGELFYNTSSGQVEYYDGDSDTWRTFLMQDGSVSMSGVLNLGANDLENVGDIEDADGNTIYDFSAGHVLASAIDPTVDADTVDGEDASAFADAGHIHDNRYYTETELNDSSQNSADVPNADHADNASRYDNIAPSDGIPGHVITTDGSNARWELPPSRFLYGSGTDGDITDISNRSRSGVIRANNYTLQGGVTVSVDQALVIIADESITVNGTIDATGEGASGGSGGNGGSEIGTGYSEPSSGGAGTLLPTSNGGSGGSGSSDIDGASGGNGDTSMIPSAHMIGTGPQPLHDVNDSVGAGGGGGGPGINDSSINESGNNGSPPGGGGAGSLTEIDGGSGDGGDGGNGGGLIVLMAPEVELNGSLVADGADGADGQDANYAPGGGGGGGTGGVAVIYGEDITNSGTISAAGGNGGTGGTASNTLNSGGDGASGDDGIAEVFQI